MSQSIRDHSNSNLIAATTKPQPTISIFVSSPGDVATERFLTETVIRRLQALYQHVCLIEPIFWEHEPLSATESFQEGLLSPRDTDIVICILWSRLGTRLPRHVTGGQSLTGTEYEFQEAMEGRKRRGLPDLLVYRKQAKPIADLSDLTRHKEAIAQIEALKEFLDKWFHGEDGSLIAAFHPFDDAATFEEHLELHLRKLIDRRLKSAGVVLDQADLPPPTWTNASPFRGLNYFGNEHESIFFGRTRAIGEAVERLKRQAEQGQAFLLVLGPSGCGKSSLVQAGVVPLLCRPGVIEGVGLCRRAVFRPADGPGDVFDTLVAALVRPEALPELIADGTAPTDIAQMLRTNPLAGALLIKGAMSQAAAGLKKTEDGRQPDARLLLVVDQLEELFTLDTITPASRQQFAAVLRELACTAHGKTWVLVTLRSDFYQAFTEVPEFAGLKEGLGQYDLSPPTVAEIGQMIRLPAATAGLRFEEAADGARLDDQLRDEAAQDPSVLPVLEFTLDELYQRKDERGRLTFVAYHELAGVKGSLARRAEETFTGLPVEVQQELPTVFRQLVTIGATDDSPTRRQVALSAFAGSGTQTAFVKAFVAARLLVTDHAADGAAVVRVTHESLLTRWQRLLEWLSDDRELLRVKARVTAATARWVAEGQPPDLLLPPGKPLQEAVELEQKGFVLERQVTEFIGAGSSRAARNRRLRRAAVAALCVLTLGIAVFAVVVAVAAMMVVREQGRTLKANTDRAISQVEQLRTADAEAVPQILKGLEPYRADILPRLQELWKEKDHTEGTRQQRMRVGLALLASEPETVKDELLAWMLETTDPRELILTRNTLTRYAEEFKAPLWAKVEDPKVGFRALVALARFDPDSPRWPAAAPRTLEPWLRENPLYVGVLTEALRPIKKHLIAPLVEVATDAQGKLADKRFEAASVLADYAADQPETLVNLLAESDKRQFVLVFPRVQALGGAALILLRQEMERGPPWYRPLVPDTERDRLASRQANVAIALMRLGQAEEVWPLLTLSPDPTRRTWLALRMASRGVPASILIDRLLSDPEISQRRALLSALGEYDDWDLPVEERNRVVPRLLTWYRDDADPGIHGAIDWLLRQKMDGPLPRKLDWGLVKEIASIDAERRGQPLAGRRWSINGQGQTLVHFEGPVEFWMGSPTWQKDNLQPNERLHRRRIERSFAIASKKVTRHEFEAFQKAQPNQEKYGPDPDCPVLGLDWYDAAMYCRWLSEQDPTIGKEDMCYPPVEEIRKCRANRTAVPLPKNYLSRKGYRLPTEAEWEYACRANTTTALWYGGGDEELLGVHAWYLKNARERSWPVGQKRPNDFGLFDMHGNTWDWTPDHAVLYQAGPGGVILDKEDNKDIDYNNRRALRGGSFYGLAPNVRTAVRVGNPPSSRITDFGLRVARTL